MITDRYWYLLSLIKNETKHLICFEEDRKCGEMIGCDWYTKMAEAGIKDCNERIEKIKKEMEKEKSDG